MFFVASQTGSATEGVPLQEIYRRPGEKYCREEKEAKARYRRQAGLENGASCVLKKTFRRQTDPN